MPATVVSLFRYVPRTDTYIQIMCSTCVIEPKNFHTFVVFVTFSLTDTILQELFIMFY